MKLLSKIAGTLVLITWAVSAQAQVDPAEVLRQAADACRNLNSIVYEIEGNVLGMDVKATVYTKKQEVPVDFGYGSSLMKVEGELLPKDKSPMLFAYAYNGKSFKMADPKTNRAILVSAPEGKGINRMVSFDYLLIPFFQFTQDHAFGDGKLRKGDSLAYQGVIKKYNREFHAIESHRMMPTAPGSSETRKSTSTWFFDSETYLPVGFKPGLFSSDKAPKWANILSVDKAIDAKVFELELPKSMPLFTYQTGLEPINTGLLTAGASAPDFTLDNNRGEKKSLADYKGKLLLVDFWGTWCAPCIRVMPKLQALHEKYKDKGLEVVGISVGDPEGRAEKFVKDKGFTYEILVQGRSAAKGFKVDTYPTFYLIDQNGRIIHSEKGVRDGAQVDLEIMIQNNLKK